MQKIIFLFSAILSLGLSRAQVTEDNRRFIEVTGTGEVEIAPDEIYVTITLRESKEKEDLSKQEEQLRQHIKDLGIDPRNLALNSANADYRQFRTFRKEVVLSRTYILKLNNAPVLSQVYERLDKMNAHDAYISRINHTKIIEHTREAKIKAIKAAKEKAEYLLAAIGQQAGAPLQVMETENFIHNPVYRNMEKMNYAANMRSEDAMTEEPEMSFRKIRIKSSFLVKFEIR